MATRTKGERAFEEYLSSIGFDQSQYRYEPPIGNRPPDFLVSTASGDVICEVKDFDLNDDDKAKLRAILAGTIEPTGSHEIQFKRIRDRIRDAREQLGEYKGRFPCLAVLFDPSDLVNLNDVTVLGAMRGDAMISVPLDFDGATEPPEPTVVFDRATRYLKPHENRTLSAVAILEYVTPNQKLLNDAVEREQFPAGPDQTRQIVSFANEFGDRHPEIYKQVPRLHVFQNPFGALPWPRYALSGPHDEFWPRP